MTDKEIMDRLSNLENIVAQFINAQNQNANQKAAPRNENWREARTQEQKRQWMHGQKNKWEQQQQYKEEDVCGDIIRFLSERVNNMGCQKGFRELTQLYIQAVVALRNQCKGVNNAERKTN